MKKKQEGKSHDLFHFLLGLVKDMTESVKVYDVKYYRKGKRMFDYYINQ